MKRILTAALALSLLNGGGAIAQPGGHQGQGDGPREQSTQEDRGRDGQAGTQGQPQDSIRRGNPRWSRGDRMPRQNQIVVSDWRQRGLRQPPRGYHWVRDNSYNYFLAAVVTGLVAQTLYQDERQQSWNQRYSRTYTPEDDPSYQQCRNTPDAAAVIIGALIGGLIGNAAGQRDNRTGATVAGVILGGAVGAAMTSNLDCQDRTYAYRSYSDGFNGGRSNATYSWRNPRNNHRGQFKVRNYYNDPGGFRCANFTQTIYIGGRSQESRGRACQQPNSTWVIVN